MAQSLPTGGPPLDLNLYALDEESSTFFKSQTGIFDDSALREHILAVQAKAYAFTPYPCIRSFGFTSLKISKSPAYQGVLTLGRERKDAILLDIGCCFGNDARKAVADGFPVRNVLASDVRRELWDFGHELFRSTPETFPAYFIAGDALEASMLEITPPLDVLNSPEDPCPDLSTLTSLNPVRGRVSAIYASLLFHLFGEQKQLHLARALAGLLSPLPGSVIFGSHIGRPDEKGPLPDPLLGPGVKMFCHCPSSWEEMWNTVFKEGTISVKGEVKITNRNGKPLWMLVWSVTRL
ncbi:hypothetical protein BJ138DRAFT_1152166 [Hygrophoropsis aurantiaca]|uniref:Uncharacterized protein n=1 Tax=Hygrophoropsis aurantiaca TaxID=72124 RepID=A0ACB8ABU5_9AGAM|nr:hypothetical protein BJ138DRAFT_1152166 [Hygrophoropsis aurantiaca]